MYRKLKPTSIFTGLEMLDPKKVLITNEDGIIADIVDAGDAGDGIEEIEGVLCPGFVNTHCHIELSHLKGKIAQQTGLVDFVQSVMTGRAADKEEKDEAMGLAATELFNSGTVAVGDICNSADSVSLKQKSPIYWHNFVEVSGFTNDSAAARLAAAKDVLDKFNTPYFRTSTLSPHAPYSVSKKLFQLLNLATENQVISIHNQEAEAENELYENKTGKFLELYQNFGINTESFMPSAKRSLPTWFPYFDQRQSIISVHNTYTNQHDLSFISILTGMDLIKKYPKLFFCLCPNANLYIENHLPPVKLFMENGLKITLGTDSYASNNTLNMMSEINTLRSSFPDIPLGTILRWATFNGAQALGIGDRYGSLVTGKKPGIILIQDIKAHRLI